MKRTAKLVVALALVAGSMFVNELFGSLTVDRRSAGCELVKEGNGGPAVLIKVSDRPPTYVTQFVHGRWRWECGADNHKEEK